MDVYGTVSILRPNGKGTALMHAIGYSEFGAAENVLALHVLPTPDPGPGDVLIEVQLSGVNPSDVKARAGNRPGMTRPPYPLIIPHSDGAGTIVAVGKGVDPDRVGKRVWIWNGQWLRAHGTCANHIVLPSDQAVDMPDDVSMETGAQLGIPGLTAAHVVFAAGPVAGKTVLVQGAAGTVGYLATQLAVWGGAKVIATARGAGLIRAETAGAAEVLDFGADKLDQRIRDAAGGPVDHIVEVEFGRNADTDAAVIAENGTISAFGSALDMTPRMPFYPLMFKAVTLHLILIYLLPKAPRDAAIQRLHKALADGALECPVARVFDLSEAAAAHRAVEAGSRDGGVLVRCT